ncbi:MAG TPA: thioredoxin-dependent thiol peroxidase [Anaerolineales bacterium]|nr:thioredoxin-dependent thiol peroxidase [Anaerolineales bacterium]
MTLQAPSPAPLFSTVNHNGELINLHDFRGKKVLLYFYPQADTPSCTTQACGLRDQFPSFTDHNIEILGISPDSPQKLRKFKEKYQLPFQLLADEDTQIAQMYGVWGAKKFMGREFIGLHRTSFLIDEQGVILQVLTNIKTKEHASNALAGFRHEAGHESHE